jgi:hypothetical protein
VYLEGMVPRVFVPFLLEDVSEPGITADIFFPLGIYHMGKKKTSIMQLVMDNKALSQEEVYKNQILFQLCHS